MEALFLLFVVIGIPMMAAGLLSILGEIINFIYNHVKCWMYVREQMLYYKANMGYYKDMVKSEKRSITLAMRELKEYFIQQYDLKELI